MMKLSEFLAALPVQPHFQTWHQFYDPFLRSHRFGWQLRLETGQRLAEFRDIQGSIEVPGGQEIPDDPARENVYQQLAESCRWYLDHYGSFESSSQTVDDDFDVLLERVKESFGTLDDHLYGGSKQKYVEDFIEEIRNQNALIHSIKGFFGVHPATGQWYAELLADLDSEEGEE